METEKLVLNSMDYTSSNTPEEIAAGVNFNSIPIVLTPFKSKCNDIEYSLDLFTKTQQNLLRITPTEFLKNTDKFTTKFLICEDLGLMKEFGYEASLLEIKSKGYNLIGAPCEFLTNPTPLTLNKYYIDCKDELIFVSLFVLYKVYKQLDIVTPDKLKTEIFCKVMQMECKVFGVDDILRGGVGDNVVVVKTYVEVSSKRVVYLGSQPTGCKEIKMDYKKVSKYIYRIKDVLKSITRDVLKGRKQFNYGRFKNILK